MNLKLKFEGILIIVEDVKKTVNFYKNAFGLCPRSEDETWTYIELDTGESTIAFVSEKYVDSNGKISVYKNRIATDPSSLEIILSTEEEASATDCAGIRPIAMSTKSSFPIILE